MLSSIIIGGGPGGLGPLIAAAQQGRLTEWLDRGVAIADRGLALGGTLGRYIINSDTLGGAYLECLEAAGCPDKIKGLRSHPLIAEMEAYRLAFPPLKLVHRYMHLIGSRIEVMIRESKSGTFLGRTDVTSLHVESDGSVRAELMDCSGDRKSLRARTAVIALGGVQHFGPHHLKSGLWLADCNIRNTMSSDDLMTSDGLERTKQVLEAHPGRSIVILGGSHSGYSAAWMLVNTLPSALLARNPVMMLQRRQPPIFYASTADAVADGHVVSSGDVCVRTKRVNRLGGLRGDGREIWRRINARPGAPPEYRVVCHDFSKYRAAKLRLLLEEAALVVTALGYRAATLPIFDASGSRMPLQADHGGPAVDSNCRVLLQQGRPILNVFGLGLGSGFQPTGAMGGEPNFKGQANSLWLYQNDIGAMIYSGIIEIVDGSRKFSGKSFRPNYKEASAISESTPHRTRRVA